MPANTALLTSQKGTSTYYSIIPADSAVVDNGNNTYEILGNVTTMDVPVFSELYATEPYVVNGNGHTVTGVMFEHEKQYWDPSGYVPTTAITFSAQNGSKVVVNDLTITGTIHNVHAGDYRKDKNNVNVTEFNNVNIINAETFVMSSHWCVGLYGCGTITLNDCNMYGTTRSTLDPYYELLPDKPIYDVILCNNSNTTINGGKYGSVRTGSSARLIVNGAEIDAIYAESVNYKSNRVELNQGTKVGKLVAQIYATYICINDGAQVDVLDLSQYNKNSFNRLFITDGAIVNKIIYAGQEFVAQEGKTAYEVLTEWRTANNA